MTATKAAVATTKATVATTKAAVATTKVTVVTTEGPTSETQTDDSGSDYTGVIIGVVMALVVLIVIVVAVVFVRYTCGSFIYLSFYMHAICLLINKYFITLKKFIKSNIYILYCQIVIIGRLELVKFCGMPHSY